MHPTAAVLKQEPADFLVRESMALELTGPDAAEQEYLLLRKCGYTTFEAIGRCADLLGLSRHEVTYAGMKDEDGITEQLVAVPARAVGAGPTATGALSAGGEGASPGAEKDGRWMTVRHYGFGRRPLEIGRLAGNAFRIVVRNLDPEHAARLRQQRKIVAFVLNYYDTQRFGVPGGPKRTHHVGAALMADDWDTALAELVGLRAPESKQAADWSGPAEHFFRSLDARVPSFYLAAHASARWNDTLADLVRETCPDSTYRVSVDGIDYLWTDSPADAIATLARASTLPYPRYRFTSGEVEVTDSQRSTVVQTVLEVSDQGPDEYRPGRARVTVSFFLSSGSYATAAVRQALGYR